jgi:hypothetical protein
MHDQGLLGLQPGQGCSHSGQGKFLLNLPVCCLFSHLSLSSLLPGVCTPCLHMIVTVGAAAHTWGSIIQLIDISCLVAGQQAGDPRLH